MQSSEMREILQQELSPVASKLDTLVEIQARQADALDKLTGRLDTLTETQNQQVDAIHNLDKTLALLGERIATLAERTQENRDDQRKLFDTVGDIKVSVASLESSHKHIVVITGTILAALVGYLIQAALRIFIGN